VTAKENVEEEEEKSLFFKSTHVMSPYDFVSSRIGLNLAIEIAVISLLDVFRI
jgi:hypothetical protein